MNQENPQSDTAGQLKAAKTWIEQQDYPRALSLLENIRPSHTDDGEISFWLAFTHAKLGNYETALACILPALEKQPANPDYLSERGIIYFHLGKNSLAMFDMDRATTLQPKNPYRYSSRAYIRDHFGDLHGAIADYEKTLKLDPADAVAHHHLCLLQEKLGSREQRVHPFRQTNTLTGIDKEYLLENPALKPKQLISPVIQELPNHSLFQEKGYFQLFRDAFTAQKGLKTFFRFLGKKFRQYFQS